MVNLQYGIDAFVNAIQQNVLDIIQRDIDGGIISFRASKAYWIDEGHWEPRWRDHGLPQISIFDVGSRTEGEDTTGVRWEQHVFQVDVLASGRRQKNSLVGQIKKGLYDNDNRMSLLSSGVKFDRISSEFDIIEDEKIGQDIYRKKLNMICYWNSSGA